MSSVYNVRMITQSRGIGMSSVYNVRMIAQSRCIITSINTAVTMDNVVCISFDGSGNMYLADCFGSEIFRVANIVAPIAAPTG